MADTNTAAATDLTAAKARLATLMADSGNAAPINPISFADSVSTPVTATGSALGATTSVSNTAAIQNAMTSSDPSLTYVQAPDGSTIGIHGDPTSLEAKPAAATPVAPATKSIGDQIASVGGIATGVVQVANYWATNALKTWQYGVKGQAADWITTIANNPVFNAALAGLSAYSLFSGIQSMRENGFSAGGLLNVGMASLGLVTGVHTLMMMLFAVTPGIGWIAGLVALAVTVLISFLFGSHPNSKPSTEEQPLIDFPSVWTSGGTALYITAGTALMTMGFNMTPTAPMTQTIVVPTVSMSTTLNNSGLQDANGNAVTGYSKYSTLFVDPGTPDRVMIVSPGSTGSDVATLYSIKTKLHFQSPKNPGDAYIPILISDGKGNMVPNPQAVQAMQNQNALTSAANALSGSSGATALQNAGTANKIGDTSSGD